MTNQTQFTDSKVGALIIRHYVEGTQTVVMPRRRSRNECKRATREWLRDNEMQSLVKALAAIRYNHQHMKG
jgi:hypothetical protein